MNLKSWPGIPSPSTRAFINEGRRTSGYTFFDWIHGYIYSRWPYLYIGIAIGEHPLARVFKPFAALVDRLATRPRPDAANRITFADTYHGKVVLPEAAHQLVTLHHDVSLTNLEHVIPYALARDIVLKNPDHIVVLDCPCRANRAHPCLPLDVCLIVGEPFASFASEHNPRRSRWITADEAVEILRSEHERGHVHHAFFKDAMLGRFYAICNCCSCCCGAMQAHRNGVPMLASSGYVARVDATLCAACGTCASYCQFRAITVPDGHAVVDTTACMGCGVCVSHCPQAALSLVRDMSKSAPLELDALLAGHPLRSGS